MDILTLIGIPIEYLERRGRISGLVETDRRLRPDISWNGTPKATTRQHIPHNLPPRSEFVGSETEKAPWLYVVTEALTAPALYLVQDPAHRLPREEVVPQMRYRVAQ